MGNCLDLDKSNISSSDGDSSNFDDISPIKDGSKENIPNVNEERPIKPIISDINNKKNIASKDKEITGTLCVGAGCYWGTQKYYETDFKKKFPDVLLGDGIGEVGFMGPNTAPTNPSYQEVCSGETGHVEVYMVKFVPSSKNYRELIKFLFQFHDPTTLNRQGNDTGTQYASVIYCYDDEQFRIANLIKNELNELLKDKKIKFESNRAFKSNVVTTDIRRATKFYPAHAEHQRYLEMGRGSYCNHRIRFKSWPFKPDSYYDDDNDDSNDDDHVGANDNNGSVLA